VTNWVSLDDELDAWGATVAQRATLWWRDDDACSASAPLARLFAIAHEHRVPIAVAAIPHDSDETLAEAVTACAEATVVQHGYAHRNHAPSGERSAEFGAHRPLHVRLDEIAAGRDLLAQRFGRRFRPVMVPPWNRIGDDVVEALPSTGIRALSCFGPRVGSTPAAELRQANTHVDPIAWRRGRGFIGTDEAVGRIVAHLRARRTEEVDSSEPTGLLTHHLAFAEDAFDFVAELIARTSRHPAVRWLDPDSVFFTTNGAVTSGR